MDIALNNRPYYALIVLAVLLAAGLALTNSSQPKSSPPLPVALAPRPKAFVAEVARPRPFDELRGRVPPSLASQEPFVDHHVLLKAAYSMSSAGVGNPLFMAKSAGPGNPHMGAVVQRPLPDETAEVAAADQVPSTIGFEEFTALVQDDSVVELFEGEASGLEELSAESRVALGMQSLSEEAPFSWQTGCGVDHNTGDVYPEPFTADSPQLAQRGEPVRAVNWWSLLRVYAEGRFSVFSVQFSVGRMAAKLLNNSY